MAKVIKNAYDIAMDSHIFSEGMYGMNFVHNISVMIKKLISK